MKVIHEQIPGTYLVEDNKGKRFPVHHDRLKAHVIDEKYHKPPTEKRPLAISLEHSRCGAEPNKLLTLSLDKDTYSLMPVKCCQTTIAVKKESSSSIRRLGNPWLFNSLNSDIGTVGAPLN
ncbi:hypothetical protein RF11_03649 [Thelohanellus kitauei]|uniref:Uncharacterized protein n=1 Tax=Thelohanellus kitauei TaxID=669202 RepID=A0A0C2JSK9_THEKT|nr:hypothetical protein RF11_03649 [Thelohanellus kitauei]